MKRYVIFFEIVLQPVKTVQSFAFADTLKEAIEIRNKLKEKLGVKFYIAEIFDHDK